ncbi:MAG: L-threonylcarbamoyladenylate synthase [Acidimicrobiales bacterium]
MTPDAALGDGAEDAIEEAVRALRRGELIGLPTETVYGLAAAVTNRAAVRRIFAVKGRPAGHPLIVHLAAADDPARWVQPPPGAPSAQFEALAAAFWPGPLTLVTLRRPSVPSEVTGGRPTVGVRSPDHPLAQRLLERLGEPVAAPSANRFGRVSPTTAADVRAELGDAVAVVLDGGPCVVGVESTIVELGAGGPMLLRPGGIPAEVIAEVLGRPLLAAEGPARASGMLASHYAPDARVVVVEPGEVGRRAAELAAAGRRVGVITRSSPAPAGVVLLGEAADAAEYARTLYRRLREADEHRLDVVVVAAPPRGGLGEAVLDRLSKAAAPRPAPGA